MNLHPQELALQQSLENPDKFWDVHAKKLVWSKPYSRVLDYDKDSGKWEWFVDGEISCAYNRLDRHVKNGLGNQTAIIWDSPVTKTICKLSYTELLEEVQIFAGVLLDLGVRKGDTILIYSLSNPSYQHKHHWTTYSLEMYFGSANGD